MVPKKKIILVTAVLLLVPALRPSGSAEGKYHPIRLGEKDLEILEVVDDMDILFDRRGYVDHDQEATALLQRVCGRVTEGLEAEEYMDFQFRIIREPLPNAFAMPNGSVYFTTGMLGALEDEAQVAAICAHEINHVLGHHTFLSMKSQRRKNVGVRALGMILGPLVADVGGLLGGILQQATGLGLQVLYVASVLGYSRDLEEEADRRAVDMVVDAGYDPTAIPEVFEILDEDYEGLMLESRTFWLDHPKLQERIRYTEAILDEEYPDLTEDNDLRRGRESYLETMEGLARHNVDLLLESRLPRTALAMSRLLVADYGEDPENLVRLGDAWRKLGGLSEFPLLEETTPKAKKKRRRDMYTRTRWEAWQDRIGTEDGRSNWERNRDNAEATYLQALARDSKNLDAVRGLGYLYETDGQWEKARSRFLRYLEEAPEARDRFVVRRHLDRVEAMQTAAEESPEAETP